MHVIASFSFLPFLFLCEGLSRECFVRRQGFQTTKDCDLLSKVNKNLDQLTAFSISNVSKTIHGAQFFMLWTAVADRTFLLLTRVAYRNLQ